MLIKYDKFVRAGSKTIKAAEFQEHLQSGALPRQHVSTLNSHSRTRTFRG